MAEIAAASVDGYHLSLCPAVAEPGFDDPDEQRRVWGRVWGASDEVGPLRMVLMRRPAGEWGRVRSDCWNEAAGALVDPDGMWYWESPAPPDLDLVDEQHEALVSALRREGVDVVFVEGEAPAHLSRPIYTRDPLLTVPGGAIVCRMAPAMRRGEEQMITRTLGSLGMPILHTVTGTAMVEGGSFAKLGPRLAAYGTSMRCNLEGARQLEEVLARFGIELLIVPLSGFSIHLDGHFGMVDVDKALVDRPGLPHWFLDRLVDLGIELIDCPRGEEWAINSLVIRPGRVLMCDRYPVAAEALDRRGVDVVTVPYSEIQKGGGGVHCSTMELVREAATA